MRRRDAIQEVYGAAQVVKLADLHSWHVLEAKCPACPHSAQLSPKRLWRMRSASLRRTRRAGRAEIERMVGATLLSDLDRVMRCTRCGKLGLAGVEVLRLPRNT